MSKSDERINRLLSLSAADIVRALRDRGMTYEELAEATGADRGYLNRIANGKQSNPGANILIALQKLAVEKGIV